MNTKVNFRNPDQKIGSAGYSEQNKPIKLEEIFANNKDDIDKTGFHLQCTNATISDAVRRSCLHVQKDPERFLNAIKNSVGKLLSDEQVEQLKKAVETNALSNDDLFKGLIYLFKTLISIDLKNVYQDLCPEHLNRSNNQVIREREFHVKVLSALELFLNAEYLAVLFCYKNCDQNLIPIIHMGCHIRYVSLCTNEKTYASEITSYPETMRLMESCLTRLENIIRNNEIPCF